MAQQLNLPQGQQVNTPVINPAAAANTITSPMVQKDEDLLWGSANHSWKQAVVRIHTAWRCVIADC